MNVISLKNVSKKFSDHLALDDISLEIGQGEFVGILGPNGAGKTTALHLMLGILTPNSGQVEIFGKSPEISRHEIYPLINFSSAYIQLPFNLKVKTNLKIFSSLYNIKNPRQKIDTLVRMFDLGKLLEERTGALSSGEQTRLNLCKCLLNDPEILFLDEPTASLDPEISERVLTILKDIHQERNMTIIYTSHNMDEVEKLCARIIFLHQGKKWIDAATNLVKAQFGGADLEKIFIKIARQNSVVQGI